MAIMVQFCYNIGIDMPDKRKGLAPNKRPIRDNKTANQYISNPRQELFIKYYLDPDSDTFASAYQSAIKAGYNKDYAKQITAPAIDNNWLQEHPSLRSYQLEHLNQKLQSITEDERAKNSDKIKSIELLAKLKGYMIERKQVQSVVKIELGKVNADIEQ